MTIDMFTNLRLVRSWGLLEQSSNSLRRSAGQLQSGQRIRVESGCNTGLAIPDSVRSRWQINLQAVPEADNPIDELKAICEAFTSLEGVLSHLLTITQVAAGGKLEHGARATIEQDLSVIGTCLKRIQTVGLGWESSDPRDHGSADPPKQPSIIDEESGEEDDDISE